MIDDALLAHDLEVAALELLQRVEFAVVPSRVRHSAQVLVTAAVGERSSRISSAPEG